MVMKRINFDYNGDIMAFYDANLEIPEGKAVRCTSVVVSERDHTIISEKLLKYYREKCRKKGQYVSESDLNFVTNTRMMLSGPSTSHTLQAGMIQLLDGYLTDQ